MKNILIIFGTRPEFIKLLPLFNEIKRNGLVGFVSVFSGQQSDLLPDLFSQFKFKPDYVLQTTNHNNILSFSFANILNQLQILYEELKTKSNIEMIIAQGDTTTAACAAMMAFFCGIRFTHIEAGLRTNDLANPFPEEFYRTMISRITYMHCVPTKSAMENLLSEGISPNSIEVTGNTIVDSVKMICENYSQVEIKRDVVLITCHRRENLNSNFIFLMNQIIVLAKRYPDLRFKWVSHTNPLVKAILDLNPFLNIQNLEVILPLNILDLYKLYDKTKLIITDSGGIQEEAISFNIPVMVFRNKTERIESIQSGYSHYCSFEHDPFQTMFEEIINSMPMEMHNPYGDGQAAKRIISLIKK